MERAALNELAAGLPVVTAWQQPSPAWQFWRGRITETVSFGCPHCRHWSEVPETALGSVHPCATCGGKVRLNGFVTKGDWRKIATTWQ